ncbi:MAG TPA: LysR family transcriptional regulator [Candidatus Sulfotelmatobacter sp.]|jgi:DNA-binding transcriptional LysR family regulator|nr:LysR family transcriptional regulator [Candidatus Sulfotelmatobacter sp.]
MIEELKRFLLVAQEGNLTRIAEKIFISQSALTQTIHRLEKELQTKLFIQKGKQLQLTEDGKSLVIIGEKIIHLWANAHDPQIRKTQIPTYSIGMFDNVALRLGTFFQSHMQTEQYNLELLIDSTGKLLQQLQLGTLDAALCVLHTSYRLPNHLTLLQIYTEKLIPVSSKSFSGPLENIPFILYNKDSHTRAQIDDLFIQYGIRPTIYAESTSVTFMRELALLGSGVALLPENFIQQDLDQGHLKKQKMPIKWIRTYCLVVQKQYNFETPFVHNLQNALKK